jgi:hypothetical protein
MNMYEILTKLYISVKEKFTINSVRQAGVESQVFKTDLEEKNARANYGHCIEKRQFIKVFIDFHFLCYNLFL